MRLLPNSRSGWLVGLFVMGFVVLGSPQSAFPAAETIFPRAVVELDNFWTLATWGDGSARLNVGSVPSDAVSLPAGTFPVEKLVVDFKAAIEIAGPTPKYKEDPSKYWRAWQNAAMSISLEESGSAQSDSAGEQNTRAVAVFTPEIKAYFDQMLATGLTENMRRISNSIPVFSEKLMKSLTTWTNSPEYKARSVSAPVTAVATVAAVAKPQEIPSPSPLKMQPPAQTVYPEPAPVATQDESIGIRGWLVVGLLAIAAFLTYRFIKLRLGS